MSAIERVLDNIIASSGQQPKDGHPLYSYRLGDSEFERLEAALAERFRWAQDLDWKEAGAFCLYAAFRFCRSYEGGPWRWELIADPIGYGGSPQHRQELVAHGLGYWRREVVLLTGQRRFLATLACEGGLPLGLLRRQDATLTRYFRKLLRARERYGDYSGPDLAEAFEDDLPRSLRNETVRELSGRLIDAVAELRTLKVSEDSEDPIEDLDRRRPGWRSSLPLSLEDDLAQRLLRSLLREKAPSRSTAGQPAIETFLELGERPGLVREASLPPRIAASQLEELFDTELINRFQLSLIGEDGARAPAAWASCQGEIFELRSRSAASLEGPSAHGTVAIEAALGSRQLGRGVPAGGRLPDDQPWVFSDEARPRLLAIGSLNTRHKAVIVALPTATETEVDGEIGQLPPLGDARRALYRLSGSLRCVLDRERYRVRTAAEVEDSRAVFLRGPRVSLGPDGSVVYQGFPQVIEVRDEEIRPLEDVEVKYVGGEQPWHPLDRGRPPIGDVYLRVQREGETLTRERILVFPEDFECSFETGLPGTAGRITLENLPVEGVGVLSVQRGLEVAVQRGAELVFELQAREDGEAPRSIEVDLMLPGSGEVRVAIGVPLPSLRFLGSGGKALEGGELVSVDGLYGMCARVIAPPPARNLSLQSYGQGKCGLGELHRVRMSRRSLADGFYELGLDRVAEAVRVLLSSSPELDATVRLKIEEDGALIRDRRATIEVGRYDAWLQPEKDGPERTRLRLPAEVLSRLGASVEKLRIRAQPLWEPEAEGEELERQEEDHWIFETTGRAPGPWLITGWLGHRCRLRPLMCFVPGDMPAPADELVAAICAPMPELESRLRAVMDALAEDAGHPAWPRMLRFIESLLVFPPGTFKAITAMLAQPTACALAAFKLAEEHDAADFQRLWSAFEEAPFLWSLVPISSWVKAARLHFQDIRAVVETTGLSKTLSIAELLSNSIQDFERKAGRECPAIGLLLYRVSAVIPEAPRPSESACQSGQLALASAAFRQARISEAKNALLHARSADIWPTADLRSARGRCGLERGSVSGRIGRHEHDFQKSVFEAPAIAAAACALEVTLGRDEIVQLQRLRLFERSWFDEAFLWFLADTLAKED